MSKVDAVRCDGKNCKSVSFDFMRDSWIEIRGTFVKYIGRSKSQIAITEIYHSPINTESKHFCSWKCLQKSTESK